MEVILSITQWNHNHCEMIYSVRFKYKLEATNNFLFFNIGLPQFICIFVILFSWSFHISMWYPKKDLRGDRIASERWMSLKELPRYITVVENLFLRERISSEKNWPNFRRLLGPIIKMWKCSGITFTITYWSEVLRLVICYVDERNRFIPSSSVWVKTHRGKRSLNSFSGLPMCLPIRIKTLCLRVKRGIASGSFSRKDQILFKLLLTCLSFFRATSPEWAEVKKSTITSDFSGSNQLLDPKSIEEALRSMGWREERTIRIITINDWFNELFRKIQSGQPKTIYEIWSSETPWLILFDELYHLTYFLLFDYSIRGHFGRLRDVTWFPCISWRRRVWNRFFTHKPTIFQMSTKAGPNANLAILGIGIDLLGWMLRPKSWGHYCLMAYRRGYWSVLNFFVLSSVLLLPLAVMFYLIGHKPWLGRIAVLNEARGKRRLIGITDWWTQVLLRPLHDDIYTFLGKLPQDGTANQSRPITEMLKALDTKCTVKTGGKRLQSMDLSAATDRLPVALQEQILNILGFEGTLWRKVLERDWDLNGETVRYSVGQPMGAYSSFASLALTHHVIVRVAAIQAGVNPSKLLYAVLGDDGALAHEKVAKYYRNIFDQLGMKINAIKGFDGTVLEFAKQLWTVNGYNISPLGAKNILLFMRNVEFLPSILYELIVKRFPLFKLEKKSRSLLNKIGLENFKNYRNWKRSSDGMRSLPFLNFTSLEILISKLFFQKRIKVGGQYQTVPFDKDSSEGDPPFLRAVRVRFRVLMSIGPRSGLWYLERGVTSWMFGSFFDGWFRSQFISAATYWGFWKKPSYMLLRWVKNDEEPSISDAIRTFKRELRELGRFIVISFWIPWTYIPNWQSWNDGSLRLPMTRKDWPIVHPMMNFMYFYIALSVPIIPNLFVSSIIKLAKLITGLWLIVRWQTLQYWRVVTIRQQWNYVYPLLIMAFLLPSSYFGSIIFGTIVLCFYNIIFTEWFSTLIRSEIHSTRGYSYWPAYDPLDSRVTTLEKVATKVKFEDSGAYRSLVRMCSGVGFVHRFLSNRENQRSKSKKIPSTSLDYSNKSKKKKKFKSSSS